MPAKSKKIKTVNFREVLPVIMVTILEGSGVEDDPYYEARYIITREGDFVGRIE